MVANYEPPGNFIGSFAENVPPLINACKESSAEGVDTVDEKKIETCDDINLKTFVNAIQKYHNDYRKRHRVPELR